MKYEYTSRMPEQIRRSRQIRDRLDSPRYYGQLLRKGYQLALREAGNETPSYEGYITRNDIDIARDIAWAIKPEIDAVARVKQYDTQERIERIRTEMVARMIKMNASPLIAASISMGAERNVGELTAIKEADLERNYKNALTIARVSHSAGEAAVAEVVAIEQSPVQATAEAVYPRAA